MDKFLKELEEILDAEKGSFNPEDNFKEFEDWDSLTLLSLMALLKEEYGVILPRQDFDKANTINELYNIVQEKLQ